MKWKETDTSTTNGRKRTIKRYVVLTIWCDWVWKVDWKIRKETRVKMCNRKVFTNVYEDGSETDRVNRQEGKTIQTKRKTCKTI